MPSDGIQQALESAASTNSITRALAVFCAAYVVYLIAALALATAVWRRDRLTVAVLVRIVVLVVVAFALSRIGSALISDPRPYIATHTQPLAPVSSDNGFPSDHVLLATALTAAVSWIDRRVVAPCALLTLLVALARLAIGAHHTLDVVGSVVIVLLAFILVQVLPFPLSLNRPVLSRGAQPKEG